MPLRAVQVGFHLDPQGREPVQLLQDWPSLVHVADAAKQAGIDVSVVQACRRAQTLNHNGVRYHFFTDGAAAPALIRCLDPDVVHIHGLCFPREVLQLAAQLPGVPLLLQDHASRPPRLWQRALWRRAFAEATGVAFCAREQSAAFSRMALLRPATQVYELAESTSRFTPGGQAEARATTGLCGDPCLLWVGHLDANKDPLTVLEGVSRAARTLPELSLWCCFGRAPLGSAVARRITSDPLLRGRVHLLGRLPHGEIEMLMRAADVFVSGSHRESTGYALIEALACGLPPLVTNIPSFRALTGDGAVARLWCRGDARSLACQLLAISAERGAAQRASVRAHFERELSFAALGRRLAGTYRELVAGAASRRRIA
ncbi:MAG: glycosyltransferase family 4 protein [Gammaproteobacteria bacterium]|nr:glycosyltransferase family 4 protein [Gammaproteobacteria bacterium]